jgi:hypothetical protein
MELIEEADALKGPPKATLARRAKSYSDFYEVAVQYLSTESKGEKPLDPFEMPVESRWSSSEKKYEAFAFEENLLDESHGEYQ